MSGIFNVSLDDLGTYWEHVIATSRDEEATEHLALVTMDVRESLWSGQYADFIPLFARHAQLDRLQAAMLAFDSLLTDDEIADHYNAGADELEGMPRLTWITFTRLAAKCRDLEFRALAELQTECAA